MGLQRGREVLGWGGGVEQTVRMGRRAQVQEQVAKAAAEEPEKSEETQKSKKKMQDVISPAC